MNGYELPEVAVLGGKCYAIRTDFRLMLKILQYLEDSRKPLPMRWQVALQCFYADPVPPEDEAAAMEYLACFISGGMEQERPGPKLIDWQLDAPAIMAGVNRVAGMEVRQLKNLHWWTFLSFFHGIGEGQLSLLVGIREKLRKGQKLQPHEQEFYRQNRDWVQMQRPDPEKERLQKLLQ